MRRLLRRVGWILVAVLAAGCSRGPDESGLRSDVQARLDELFGRPVLAVQTLRRQGSAPYAAADDGAKQAIVYYNATLAFVEAYDPSDWSGLSPQLIAMSLGATDQGVVGLEAQGMAPGSELRAYGSLLYRRVGGEWRAAPLEARRPEERRPPGGAGPKSRADELVERLSRLVDTTPGLHGEREEIVAEELDRALQNIRLRLGAGPAQIVVATGPANGEYARFMESLEARLGKESPIRLAATEGSVSNAFLIDRDRARFGLVQSDVAAAAVAGDGLFAASGPLTDLRAVASLFPEPLHVVVRADSDIESLSGLADRRIVLGAAGSGTRLTALRVLAAAGLEAGAYVEGKAPGPGDALAMLARGEVDAVLEVVSAPWRQLWKVSRDAPLRLLPLESELAERVSAELPGIVPLDVPSRTYPGQTRAVRTVAATALLVANSAVPDETVASALETVFAAGDVPGGGISAARLSRRRALTGITIPLHEGAARYFESAGVQAPDGP